MRETGNSVKRKRQELWKTRGREERRRSHGKWKGERGEWDRNYKQREREKVWKSLLGGSYILHNSLGVCQGAKIPSRYISFSLFNLVFLSFSLPSHYGVESLCPAYGIFQTNFVTSSCIVVAFLVAGEDERNYASTTFGWHYNFHSPRVMFLEIQLPHSVRWH